MEQKKVGIYGFGTMGVGIACALIDYSVQAEHKSGARDNGYKIFAYDENEEALLRGRERIKKYITKRLFGKLTPTDNNLSACEAITENILSDYLVLQKKQQFTDCFLVIECVPEDKALKQEVFRKLSREVGPSVIIASNTSSIPIHYMAEVSEHPERVIGIHFSNPPTHVKGIEIIPSVWTFKKTIDEAIAFLKNIGQEIFLVEKDTAGFVGNRLLGSFGIEGCRLLEEGIASREAIDGIAKKHLNLSYGPLEVMDLIGLDVFMHFLEIMVKELPGGERFTPPAMLKKLVAEGKLGKKTRQGFYSYPKKP